MQIEGQRKKAVEVRRLFHGTRGQYVDAICQHGFDFRLHGSTTGYKYGRGSYFARDAAYSLPYSDCRKLLVVQVIVGDYTVGDCKMYRPPPKDPSEPHGTLYDTCVNDVGDPSIFVTFERWQSYPEYLLEYT